MQNDAYTPNTPPMKNISIFKKPTERALTTKIFMDAGKINEWQQQGCCINEEGIVNGADR